MIAIQQNILTIGMALFIGNGLLMIHPANATGIHTSDAVCPIDEADTVKLYFEVSSNEYGGFDSDGATYSSGTQFREHAISTCSKTLFSAYTEDMQKKISPSDSAEIKKGLTPLAQQYTNPTVWERYELAVSFYRWQGKDPIYLAQVYMEAAWTARDKAVGIHPDLKGPVVADQILEQGKKELKKELTNEERKMVTYNLARVAHRNARFTERQHYITQFLNDPTLETYERDTAQEFIQLTTEVEPRLLKLALAEYLIHLQKVPQDGHTQYIVADIFRRLGEYTQARTYFEKANLSAYLHPEQRMIVAHLLETMPSTP